MSWLAPHLWQQGVRLRGAGAMGRYGNTSVDWADVDEVELPVYIDLRRSNERTVDEQQLVQEAVAFVDTGSDVVATDRIVVDGITWDVAGTIPRAFAGVAHLELILRREIGV